MTDEIIKLYENAGVNQVCNTCELRGFKRLCPSKELCVRTNPPFTAEKQIAIENIIFQCNFGICELQRTMLPEFTKDNKFVKHYFSWWYHAGDIGYYDEITDETYGDWDVEYSNPDRKEALAGFVNALWDEHLTSEEKQQVKGILE